MSLVRNPAHAEDVEATGAVPRVLSLEDDEVTQFRDVFEGVDVVYFCAGAGGKDGPERTRKVDYEGALKVFDAIELVKDPKPRLIVVSTVDSRDPNVVPDYYVRRLFFVSRFFAKWLLHFVAVVLTECTDGRRQG